MMTMRRGVGVVGSLVCLLSGAALGAAPTDDVSAQLRQFWKEVQAACDGNDFKAWATHFDDQAFMVENTVHRWTKEEVWKENCGAPRPEVVDKSIDRQTRVFGETVIDSYIWEKHQTHNGKVVVERAMMLDTYLRRKGKLVQIGSAEIAMYPPPPDPPTVAVAPEVLDTYVGEYEWAPGKNLTVYREGNRLLGKAWNDPSVQEFAAENERTFFGKGEGWRQIFVKDASGRVKLAIFRNHGVDFELPRVK